VAAVTPDAVRAFFERWYRPTNMVVAVAGAIEHDDVVARVERAFRAPAGGEVPPRTVPGVKVRPLASVRKRSEQAHLAIGFRAFDRRHPDREALDVLNHVLGGGMSSRLFDEIREKRGLAYSVYSATSAYADAGVLMVYAGTSPSRAGEVLELIDVELDRVRADSVTPDEMAVAQGYLAGSYLLGLEDSASRMSRLGGSLLCLGEVRDVDEQVARYRAVGQDDVARVATALLDGPRSLAAVGPLTRAQLVGRS
jgi:predicted Zn-dependent peptidase